MEGFLANALNGLSWGMLLFLTSVGLTTIFGVMGVLNFAHGSLFMLGAYLCMQFVRWVGSFWIGLFLGPPIVAGLSISRCKRLAGVSGSSRPSAMCRSRSCPASSAPSSGPTAPERPRFTTEEIRANLEVKRAYLGGSLNAAGL